MFVFSECQSFWKLSVFKAAAVWQWWNHHCAQVSDGKSILRINLDETAVCLFQGGCKGTIFTGKKRQRGEAFQRVAKGNRRCYLTHVALICDRADIQPLLPQTLIGNEHTFPARSMAALRRGRAQQRPHLATKECMEQRGLVRPDH